MSDSFVTQCPQCRTSFRVSQVQLSAAQGSVRCGACLHVFNARQHLLEPSTAVAASPSEQVATVQSSPLKQPTVESSAEARKDSLDSILIHDDMDLDSLDLDEELARLELEEQLHTHNLAPLAFPPLRQPTSMAPAIEPKADEQTKRLQGDTQRPSSTHSVSFIAPEIMGTLEPDAGSTGTRQGNHDDSPDHQGPNCNPDEVKNTADQVIDAEAERIEPAADTAVLHTAARFSPNDNLIDLSQDPLQLHWHAPGKPWGRWLGWGLLNLIAAGALLTQYSVYHFNELARQDQYRPWLESICPQLGCTVPPKVDVGMIKSSNLVIRSHPDFAGALVVDAILYNRASFEQPFPLLELHFSDINNKLLANRRFKPAEYLAGELAGRSEMPPQTPIHISLDILDPGQEAVNYNLTFQSPE